MRTSFVFLCLTLFLNRDLAAQETPPIPETINDFSFNRFELTLGPRPRQSIITGFLSGNELADIAVIQLDEKRIPKLRIYSYRDTKWRLSKEHELPHTLSMVDVIRMGNHDRLLGYDSGKLVWVDAEPSDADSPLDVPSMFKPPRSNEIPHVDMSKDLNADGREDLVIPTLKGYWIAPQNQDQSFAPPIYVGEQPNLEGIYGSDGYRYDPWAESQIHLTDFNHDGRSDLVYWSDGQFEVHHQTQDGRFATHPRNYPAPPIIDTNKPHALAEGNMTGSLLQTMTDLNQDGTTDLVIMTLEGRSISRKRSRVQIHYGRPSLQAETEFLNKADVILEKNDSIYIGCRLTDLDHTGTHGILLTSIPKANLTNSLWKQLKGLMGDDIRLTLDFHQSPLVNARSNYSRRIALDGFPSHREPGYVPLRLLLRGAKHVRRKTERVWPRAFNPTMLLGDVTGDGESDLLMSAHPKQLTTTAGIAGPSLFSEENHSIRVNMPDDGEYVWLTDLNQDQKKDIILHRTFIERDAHGGRQHAPGTESQQLEILVAR